MRTLGRPRRARRPLLLGLVLALLGPGCRRSRPLPPVHPPPASAPAAPLPDPVAPPLPPVVVAPLVRVPQLELPALPTRFSADGRLLAVLEGGDSCQLWDLAAQAHLGQVAALRCRDWLPARCVSLPAGADGGDELPSDPSACAYRPPGDLQRSSPDGRARARWHGATLTLTIAEGPPAMVGAGCQRDDCGDVVAVAFSPDSKLLAVARKLSRRLELVDVESGKSLRRLQLPAGALLLPELLAWGPRGLVAVLGLRQRTSEGADPPVSPEPPVDAGSSDEEASEPDDLAAPRPSPSPPSAQFTDKLGAVRLAVWKSPSSPQRWLDFARPLGDGESESTLTLDPLGRYLFELRSAESDGTTLTVFDVAADREAALSWHHPDAADCQNRELKASRWRPGKWPVWEVIEGPPAGCPEPAPLVRSRLSTAPGQRRLEQSRLRQLPPGLRITSEPRDPSQRFEARAPYRLRRLSDGVELDFSEPSCPHTADWLYDCRPAAFSRQLFLRGSDPLTATVVRSEEVAPRFYHPQLVDDFFAGRPLPPPD